jgi:poly(3-hydroxybutyrate) depolymerase
MSMNLDRHVKAHKDLFEDLVRGDGDSADKHREFYDEYLAVMDLTAEFFLQTIDTVFVRHALPKGEMVHRGCRVDPAAIRRVALMTIEGEKDDITGLGQCRAAHALCSNIGDEQRLHIEAKGVGHYGIFNGSRFRAEIAPRIAQFVRMHDTRSASIPVAPAVDRQQSVIRSAAHVHELSSVAFTFAAANDSGADPMAAKLRAQGFSGVMAEARYEARADAIDTPFKLWALAGHLMFDGLLRLFGLAYPAASQTERRREAS